MVSFLCDLLAHAEWANAVFFHIWGKSPARDHEEMRKRILHLVAVQQGFLAVIRGETPQWQDEGPPPSFADLRTRAVTSHAELSDFVAGLTAYDIAQTVRIPWFPDPPCEVTVAEALIQVAMHSQHHRGQCMTRLKELGGEPKNVDWIIWLRKAKPAGRWD